MFRQFDRLSFAFLVVCFIFMAIITKMFFVVIVKGDYYKELAINQHQGRTIIPANRGKILVKDYYSQEYIELATNITKDLIFVDPVILETEGYVEEVVNNLAPLIFELVQEREEKIIQEKKVMQDMFKDISNNTVQLDDEEAIRLNAKKEADIELYRQDLINKIKDRASKWSRYLVLLKELPYHLSQKLEQILEESKNKKMYRWVGLLPESYRYYPEGEMLAPIIGFVNHDFIGQYWIEGQFDSLLKGKDGRIISEQSTGGRKLAMGKYEVKEAQHGADVYLTIDRAVQLEIESKVEKYIDELDASSGQVIVLDTKTGKVLSMVNYPSFNPNDYGSVYEQKKIKGNINQLKNKIAEEHRQRKIFKKEVVRERIDQVANEEGQMEEKIVKYLDYDYFMYENKFGLEVFKNKCVMNLYEPGSIFKPLVIAIGLDAKEITPETKCDICGKPIVIDKYVIRTWDDKYRQRKTMTEVIMDSDNIGMVFAQRRIGKSLFYKYIKAFGFEQKTDLGLDNEARGMLNFWKRWSDVEAANISFGQGISATPIQMITSINALANGGKLMRPYLIEKIENEQWIVDFTKPKVVNQVITTATASMITAILTVSVEKGGARTGRVDGYNIAGKTGTAQIAKVGIYDVGYETGAGTTIASFVGYGPTEDPRFTVLVKVDRPRTTQWWSEAAGPLFADIMNYLLRYYEIEKTE